MGSAIALTAIIWLFAAITMLGPMMGDCLAERGHSCPTDFERKLSLLCVALMAAGINVAAVWLLARYNHAKNMATDAELPLRNQLMEARDRIVVQLNEMDFRSTIPRSVSRGGPPDYRGLVAELQNQLSEIDALLDAKDSPNT